MSKWRRGGGGGLHYFEVLKYVEKDGQSDAKKHQARGLLDHINDFVLVVSFALDVAYLRTRKCFVSINTGKR
jgi:hypothetical protein